MNGLFIQKNYFQSIVTFNSELRLFLSVVITSKNPTKKYGKFHQTQYKITTRHVIIYDDTSCNLIQYNRLEYSCQKNKQLINHVSGAMTY